MEEQWQCEEFCTHNHLIDEIALNRISEEKSMHTAELFKALGDNTRVKILYYLLQSELCVCDLTVLIGATQSATSHQLRILRNLRIVQGRKEGKQVIYSICNDHVRLLLQEALAF